MKEYLLSVWGAFDETDAISDEAVAKMYADVAVFNDKLKSQGHWVFAGGLHPVSTASVVRPLNGEVITTDGPFAEAREHLGGVWVIQAADLDVALALAREAAVACGSAVEVRPFQDMPDA